MHRETQKGHANRATLAVAWKLVAYLMAVPRGQRHFLVLDRETCQVLPLNRLGANAQAPDVPVGKFRDWQENTNSILLGSRRNRKLENWFRLALPAQA